MLQVRTVLHPTDFSENAHDALHIARSLARDHRAHLVLLTVAPHPPEPVPDQHQFLEPRKEYEVRVREDRRRLEVLAATILDVPVETMFDHGIPGPTIVAAAAHRRADLVVMGLNGEGRRSRRAAGRVAEHVLRHAPCPVLTIHRERRTA